MGEGCTEAQKGSRQDHSNAAGTGNRVRTVPRPLPAPLGTQAMTTDYTECQLSARHCASYRGYEEKIPWPCP